MKNNKEIILPILAIIAIYLLTSFVVLDVNFKNWVMEVRLLYSLISPLISFIIYLEFKDDKK